MKTKIIVSLFVFSFVIGCSSYQYTYTVIRDEHDEPMLGKGMFYTFNEKPTPDDLKKIDTTQFYIQVFEGRYYNEQEMENPLFLAFDSDGYYQRASVKHYALFPFRTKKSLHYGGKYKITGSTIELESFVPVAGYRTDQVHRMIQQGRIEKDKIYLDFKDERVVSVYKKVDTLK